MSKFMIVTTSILAALLLAGCSAASESTPKPGSAIPTSATTVGISANPAGTGGTATPARSSELAATPIPATPTIPAQPHLNVGSAQVFVTGWNKTASQREGWFDVTANGIAVNTRTGVRLYDLLGQNGQTPDLTFSSSLDSYTAHIHGPTDLDRGYRQASTDVWPSMPLPAGAGIAVEITGEVPQTAGDIEISYSGATIRYGEASQASLIGNLHGAMDPATPCDITRATVSFDGFEQHSASTLLNGTFTEQFVVFDVNNSRGQDLNIQSTEMGPLFLLLLTKDGRSIVQNNGYYTDEIDNSDTAPPGFSKQTYIPVSSTALDPNGIVDTSGGTIVLTYYDANQPGTPPQFCVWRLQ